MEPTNPTISTPIPPVPAYQEMIKEMGVQLSARKGDLFKRTVLIVWPVVLLGVFGWAMKHNPSLQAAVKAQLSHYSSLQLGIGFFAVILVLILYTGFVTSLLNIEKHLWIDAYFDKEPMTSAQSWRVALKMFVPSIYLSLWIFIRFYLAPILIVIACGALVFVGFGQGVFAHNLYIPTGAIVALLLGGALYFYLLRARLRYLYFLFLDTYNPTVFTYGKLFSELADLSQVSRSESFKKAVFAQFGTDMVNSIVQRIASVLLSQLKYLGSAGELVDVVARPMAKEMIRQATDYARLTANYLLYRQARTVLYGQTQMVNEYMKGIKGEI